MFCAVTDLDPVGTAIAHMAVTTASGQMGQWSVLQAGRVCRSSGDSI